MNYPHLEYGVVCHLVHIEELRRNLFRGVVQGQAFCVIGAEEVESEVAVDGEDEEFFYRTCQSKEISEVSETNPTEYNPFFLAFNRIGDGPLKNQVLQRIDGKVFAQRNDPVALFYCVIGILNIDNQLKYTLATSFDDQKRVT